MNAETEEVFFLVTNPMREKMRNLDEYMSYLTSNPLPGEILNEPTRTLICGLGQLMAKKFPNQITPTGAVFFVEAQIDDIENYSRRRHNPIINEAMRIYRKNLPDTLRAMAFMIIAYVFPPGFVTAYEKATNDIQRKISRIGIGPE